jgi:hypothetical protein
MGEHGKCTTRVGWGGNSPDGPHTHIVGRSGAALANLWTTGKPCRWVCSCTKCAANGGFTQAAPF